MSIQQAVVLAQQVIVLAQEVVVSIQQVVPMCSCQEHVECSSAAAVSSYNHGVHININNLRTRTKDLHLLANDT